ncbi:hypothetical protein ABQD97_00625 [Enterococcus avium]|uniref:ABC transporter permease n=1 Tax=Enterococcus avium TaxID=33945 RepID=A0ABD5F4G5_ENTAV|nr:hypothetical protein [Enterococcus avium]MDT2396471.1 hypothetical protein [Enterococcus avium]MDT2434534.1 hypothetical protein [Enterococcus avium]MDT2465137.1 hypothetical protein [Enterococcus avium]MDT2481585.1 hypothetical protein [Enterococcus avium]MDT2504563.1 hypothetical protein [Enterococcus avium]
MQKRMDRISMAAGYGMLIIAVFLKIIGGVNQRFSLVEVWIRSLISGNFLHFWQTEFSSGIGVLVGTGAFLLLLLAYVFDSLLITCHRKNVLLQSAKVAWLYFTMFFYFIFIQFYSSSIWLVLLLIIGALEFLLNRYLDDKIERDRKYAESQKIEKHYNEDRKRRLAFPGKYPPAFHQIIRKNFRFYRKNYFLLIFANTLVFFALVILFFAYQKFSASHTQETVFNKTGLLRILIESGGVLLILLLLFLSFMDGLYIDFKAKHMELFIQLGIRKKTFLIMLIEEFSLCAFAGVVFGGSLGLLITRAFTSIGWALLFYTGLIILAMAFHQEKILRLIQFKPREQTKADRPNHRLSPVFLLIGLLALAVTFWWFHRRKSAETLLVISTLIIALWGLFLGIGGFYVKRRREKITLLLSRNDLFYRFHKSINVLMLVSLLQVLIAGIFLPRVVTFQQTAVDNLFPYDVVAKVKSTEFQQVETSLNQEKALWKSYPFFPVTSVDGDPEWEVFGTVRPVMFIQGQHIGVSETTYQQLRQANDLEKQPLHLKKGQWHVVYQQAISIRGQPIDWDPQSVRPRLRIGTPLESYNTTNVDVIFPMRTIKSQERLILTGMFQRGLQENILVVADEEFATLSKKDQPNQLFLIHGDKKIAHALNFLNQKYVDDKRWDDTIEPVYEKTQRKSNVVSENYLQVLLLIFTIVICIFMSVGLIVAKFESEETRLIERRRLLDQLGMRQKEQRSVLERQVGFFTVLPLAVGFLLSLGFIGIMGRLRFFSMSEWLQFGGIFLLDFGIYLFVWGTIASLIYRRIEKWR